MGCFYVYGRGHILKKVCIVSQAKKFLNINKKSLEKVLTRWLGYVRLGDLRFCKKVKCVV